jgi:hypothetical protein
MTKSIGLALFAASLMLQSSVSALSIAEAASRQSPKFLSQRVAKALIESESHDLVVDNEEE